MPKSPEERKASTKIRPRLLFAPKDITETLEVFPIPTKPKQHKLFDSSFHNLKLPDISGTELAKFHQYATEYLNYGISLAARSKANLQMMQTAMTRNKAHIRLLMKSQPKNVVDAEIAVDENLQQLQDKIDVQEALCGVTEAEVEIWSNREKLLSRELTRRVKSLEVRDV